MINLTKLHALLDKIDTSEWLYEQQTAAHEFSVYGRDLLRVVEAARDLDEYRYTNQWGSVADEHLRQLRSSLAALNEEDV